MNAVTVELAMLRQRLDVHDEQFAQTTAQFTALFDLVRAAYEHAAIDAGGTGGRLRPGHLHLVKGGRQ